MIRLLDGLLGLIVQVHVADHALQLISGENIAKYIEDLAGLTGIQIVLDLFYPLEQLLHHPAFARVGRHEIEDEAVLLLTVTMDTAHALLQTGGVPRDVVVDHEPAELEIDSLTRCFCGNKHLCTVAIPEDHARHGDACRACRDLRFSCRHGFG